ITATPVSIATYDTDVGEIRTITLSDGSEITLGAASAVSVTLAAQRRSVTLDRGEAFFAVSSDPSRPFAVQVDQLTVTVVGTAFDVRRSADVLRVAVAEGVVDVSQPFAIGDRATDINDNKRLRKGETVTATVHDGISAISAINPATVGNWRDGRLQYDGVSLAEVVADANRYSKIPIQLEPLPPEVEGRLVRGVYRGNDVENLLLSVAELLPITIDRSDPGLIVIRSEPAD
ncbi:MAG: FecR domain-containing protein, partial [Pseudomonadota bacterium]